MTFLGGMLTMNAYSLFAEGTAMIIGPITFINDQRDLANLYAELDRRGCLLMLSNSDTPLVRELYAHFRVHCVSARRMINSDGKKRGPVSEVVVLNYGPKASRKPTLRPR